MELGEDKTAIWSVLAKTFTDNDVFILNTKQIYSLYNFTALNMLLFHQMASFFHLYTPVND